MVIHGRVFRRSFHVASNWIVRPTNPKVIQSNYVGWEACTVEPRSKSEIEPAHLALFRRLGRLALRRLAADVPVRRRGRGPVANRHNLLPGGDFVAPALDFDPPGGGAFVPVALAFPACRCGAPDRLPLDLYSRPLFPADDLRQRITAADAMQKPEGVPKIALAAGVGADDDGEGAGAQGLVGEGREVCQPEESNYGCVPSPRALWRGRPGPGLQRPGAVFDRRRQDGGRGRRALCRCFVCRGCALISRIGDLMVVPGIGRGVPG